MKLAIEILKREITQMELAQKHDHLRKDEVELELESLNKAVKKLTTHNVIKSVCKCMYKEWVEKADKLHCTNCDKVMIDY